MVFASELAETFDWSQPTAAAVITALMGFDLVAKRVTRDANGRIVGVVYQALPPVLWQKPLSNIRGTSTEPLSNTRGTSDAEPLSNNQGTSCQGPSCRGTRIRGTNVEGHPLHEPPSVERSSRTPSQNPSPHTCTSVQGKYASPPSAAEAPPLQCDAVDAAWLSDRLLGWLARVRRGFHRRPPRGRAGSHRGGATRRDADGADPIGGRRQGRTPRS